MPEPTSSVVPAGARRIADDSSSDDNDPLFMVGGFALGYQNRDFQLGNGPENKSKGIHGDIVFVSPKLSLGIINPSLTTSVDLGLGPTAMSAGVGPGLHLGIPFFQMYGKVMLNGHLASIDGSGRTGWSADAVVGGQVLIGYVELRAPLASSNDLQTGPGLSTGVRFGF